MFEEILAGKTNVVESPDAEYNAKTEFNETTGIKTITLGKFALENGARFGLNILFAHEAYRNGRDDGEDGQRTETNNAVLGHINIAARLGMTYGMDSLSDSDRKEIDALQKAAKGDVSAILGILGGYDASADYWKIIKDGAGNISYKWDGKHELSFEGFSLNDIKDMLSKFAGKRMDNLSDDDLERLSVFIKSRQNARSATTAVEIKQVLIQMQNVTKYRFEAESVINDTTKTEKDRQKSLGKYFGAIQALRDSALLGLNASVQINKNIKLPTGDILPFETDMPLKVTTLRGGRLNPVVNDPAKDGLLRPQYHGGIDIGTNGRVASYLAFSNGMLSAAWSDTYGLRGTVTNNDNTISMAIAHMNVPSLDVWLGAAMTQGTAVAVANNTMTISGVLRASCIGFPGTTGYSSGNHACWEIKQNNDQIDPITFMTNNGLREGVDFFITPNARLYSGLESLIKMKDMKIDNPRLRPSLTAMVGYFDTNNTPVTNWIANMETLGKHSRDVSNQLSLWYPNSRVIREYANYWNNIDLQSVNYQNMMQNYWRSMKYVAN